MISPRLIYSIYENRLQKLIAKEDLPKHIGFLTFKASQYTMRLYCTCDTNHTNIMKSVRQSHFRNETGRRGGGEGEDEGGAGDGEGKDDGE